MATRMLRDWTDSETVNSLTPQAECFFVRLIMKADDFGRFHGNPRLLKSLLFPLKDGIRDTDISRWLAECEKAGLLAVYNSGGKPFVEIRKFDQRLRQKVSKFPASDSTSPTNDGMLRTIDSGAPTGDGLKRREVDLEIDLEEEVNTCSDLSTKSKQPEEAPQWKRIYFDFKKWEWEEILESDLAEWKNSYPACDIGGELAKMACWIKANPKKGRKTNYAKFINNWLSRAQDSGGTK